MTKKKSRRRSPAEHYTANPSPDTEPTMSVGLVSEEASTEDEDIAMMTTTETKQLPALENIRAEALQRHTNAAHTIAELEAWRNEIDATIAFLKAQRK